MMHNQTGDTQEMNRMSFHVDHVETRTATCPTCGKHSTFSFHGEQTWPEKVAKAAGLPQHVLLWQCTTCGTTLLEPSLSFDKLED